MDASKELNTNNSRKRRDLASTSGRAEAKRILKAVRDAEFLHNLKPRAQARLDEYLNDPSKFDRTYAGFTQELLTLLREKMDNADQVLSALAVRTRWAKDELDQLDEDDRVYAGEMRPKNKHKAEDSVQPSLESLSKSLETFASKFPLGDTTNASSCLYVCDDPLCSSLQCTSARLEGKRKVDNFQKRRRPKLENLSNA